MDKKSYDNGTDNNRKCCKNKQLSGTESVHHEDG